MKLSQQVLVPDEQVGLTKKVMDRIPGPTFTSLFPEPHTVAKLLDKAQRIQKNIEGGDGGEREMRLRDLALTVGSSGQNYLHPSTGHQAVFLR